MLFFGKKKRALQAVLEALRPLTANMEFELDAGSAPGLWSDAYSLGYLLGTATHFAGLAVRSGLKDEALGMVLIAAFRTLSGSDGEILVDRALKFQEEKNADFLTGARNSDKAIAIALGLDPLAGDADVARARQDVVTDGREPDDNKAVAWALHEALFFAPVRARLS